MLAGNSDVLSASASWGQSTGELHIKVAKKGRKHKGNSKEGERVGGGSVGTTAAGGLDSNNSG